MVIGLMMPNAASGSVALRFGLKAQVAVAVVQEEDQLSGA